MAGRCIQSPSLLKGEVPLIGTGSSTFFFIHVDDAAQATVAALTVPAGLYNVVDTKPTKVFEWLPAYARWIGSDAPPRFDEQEAFHLLGEESVYYQNDLTGACNQQALQILGLNPQQLSWLGE